MSEEYIPNVEELAWEQWGNSALIDLADSTIFRVRAALAAHLATREEPELTTIGHANFEAIAVLPTIDPLTLWHLTHYCRAFTQSATCEEQKIIERLGRADPKNIAALLIVDQYLSGESWSNPEADSIANHQLLESLADADLFDEYWGRGFFHLLTAIEQYSLENPPPSDSDLFKQFSVTPSFWVLAPIMVNGLVPGFSKLFKLCEFHAKTTSQADIQRCLKIARTMQESSKTFLGRNMGTAIEEIVQIAARPGSADAILAERKRAALRKTGICGIPMLQQGRGKVRPDDETIEVWTVAYFRDLNSLGEIQAAQRAAEREYAKFPEQYPSNPSECPDVLAMSNGELAEFLGDDDPILKSDSTLQ